MGFHESSELDDGFKARLTQAISEFKKDPSREDLILDLLPELLGGSDLEQMREELYKNRRELPAFHKGNFYSYKLFVQD